MRDLHNWVNYNNKFSHIFVVRIVINSKIAYLMIIPKICTTQYHKILKYVVHKCVIQLSFQIRLKLIQIVLFQFQKKT